jgi:hypothetical protein
LHFRTKTRQMQRIARISEMNEMVGRGAIWCDLPLWAGL